MLLNSPRANAVLQTDLINTRHDRLQAPWLRLGWCTTAFLTCHPRVPPQNDLMLPRVFCEKKLERGVIVLQGVPSEPWSPQNLPRSREESGCLILPPITKATVILKMTPQQVSYGCPWMGSWVPFLFLVVGKMWYTNLYWRSGPGPTRARFSQMRSEIPHGAMFMGTCIKKVMILQVLVLLQVPPPSPMLTYATLLRQYSCAIVYRDLWRRQRSATFYRSSQDGYHNTWLMLTV